MLNNSIHPSSIDTPDTPQQRVQKKYGSRGKNRIGVMVEDTDPNNTNLKGTGYTVDLDKLPDILLKRITMGIGKAPAPHYLHGIQTPPFIYETVGGAIKPYNQWDVLRDDLGETCEEYLARHYQNMHIKRIVLLPNEPTYMQASVAREWANRLSFDIPLPTVRRYMENTQVYLLNVRHVYTEDFFLYLHRWAKRPSPYGT